MLLDCRSVLYNVPQVTPVPSGYVVEPLIKQQFIAVYKAHCQLAADSILSLSGDVLRRLWVFSSRGIAHLLMQTSEFRQNKTKLESVQLRRHCNSKATPTSRQSIWNIISIFCFFCSKILRFGKFRVATTNAGHVTPCPLSTINQKACNCKSIASRTPNDIAPDVLGFSGLFGLKILFLDVLRSAPSNRHVNFA